VIVSRRPLPILFSQRVRGPSPVSARTVLGPSQACSSMFLPLSAGGATARASRTPRRPELAIESELGHEGRFLHSEPYRGHSVWLTTCNPGDTSSSTFMSARQYERETTIVGLNGSVFALEFSPDRGVLACGCEDGSVTVFSTFTWKPLHIFANVSPSTSLAWHPHIEGLLFCGFKSGDVHALQTNHTRVRSKEPTGHRSPLMPR